MEVTLDALYGSAEIASSCYGAIITVQSVMRSVRMTYIPAHTVKQAIIENGTIHWQFHLEASCWKLEGGSVIFRGVYDLIIDATSNINPNTSNDDMGH